MPLSAVLLMDADRLVLRAQSGFSGKLEAAQLPQFVLPLIETGKQTVIEDLRLSPAFAKQSLVNCVGGLRLLFAAPIMSPELEPVGLVLAADTRVRRASGEETSLLADLALFIERELVLRSLLRTDPLTGLYNRLHYEVEIEREWRRSTRSKSPLAALLINVDGMSDFNDTYGSERGDAALRRVAEHLGQRFLRSSDLLVRLQGDEFLIVLPETGAQAASVLAEEIRLLVQRLEITHPYSVSRYLSVSIGSAATVTDAGFEQGAKGLLARCRKHLEIAKADGRNRVHCGEAN
jgi:diguanylate cyclase (GGDEF)-like protein